MAFLVSVNAALQLACRSRDSSSAPSKAGQQVAAVDTVGDQPGARRSPDSDSLLGVIYGVFQPWILLPPDDVRSRFAQDPVVDVVTSSTFFPRVDTIVQLRYGQLRFRFFTRGESGYERESPYETRVAAEYPPLARLHAVGTREQAHTTLGPPDWTGTLSDTTVYQYNYAVDCAEEQIKLYFVRDRLVELGVEPGGSVC